MTDINEQELDDMFGKPKSPTRVYDWEQSKRPLSSGLFDRSVAERLRDFAKSSDFALLKFVARTLTFIWVMDKSGQVHLAVEEIAVLPARMKPQGHPRRRHYPVHPSDDKKLGHPTVLDEGSKLARIAGELFLDFDETNNLMWFVNDNSGRYCKNEVPTVQHKANILHFFQGLLGVKVQFDHLKPAT
jgi:hypothetical protein